MPSRQVLVMDPNPDNRESLAQLLRLHGYAAEPVDGTDELLARLHPGFTGVVVTEITGDPARTARQVRAVAPRAAVAFHTTQCRPEDARRSAALGCPHFVKPCGADQLLAWLAATRPGRDPSPRR